MMQNSFSKFLATLGPIGYLPAPGTWASCATLIVVYFLHLLNISHVVYAVLIVLFTIVAWYAVVHTLDFFRTWGPHRQMGQNWGPRFFCNKNWGLNHDPSEIVVDEAVGCMVTFFMIPITMRVLIIGFILFRLFDIAKPCGLKRLEKMGGAWGILLDDIGAGLLSNVMLNLLLFFSVI